MIFTVLSVKLKEVSSLSDFANLDEQLRTTYVWLLFAGAGWVSFDDVVKLAVSAMIPRPRAWPRTQPISQARRSATRSRSHDPYMRRRPELLRNGLEERLRRWAFCLR